MAPIEFITEVQGKLCRFPILNTQFNLTINAELKTCSTQITQKRTISKDIRELLNMMDLPLIPDKITITDRHRHRCQGITCLQTRPVLSISCFCELMKSLKSIPESLRCLRNHTQNYQADSSKQDLFYFEYRSLQ